MGLKIQGNDLQGAKIAISYRNTQGPCPRGFHIGSKDEWQALIDALKRLRVYTESAIPTVLNIPNAYYLSRGNGSLETKYGMCRYWTSTMVSNASAWAWGIDQNRVIIFQEDKPGNAFSIRPFKDEPVIPDSSWTEFPYGVFKNTTLGLISIQNASNWITISDKNLGATNVGDNGLYYQFGNNYGFSPNPSIYVTKKPTFSDEYGPQNPYNSPQFVRVSKGNNWFDGTCNDIWGGVNPTRSVMQVKDVQAIYIGTTKVRPSGWKPGANTIAYYPLTANFNDESGNGYNLSGGGSITTIGGVSCAYLAQTARAENSSASFGTTRTISVWLNSDMANTEDGVVVWTGGDGGANTKVADISLGGGSNINGGNFYNVGQNSGVNVTKGVRYHAVMVCSGGTIYIYVNGELKANTSMTLSSGNGIYLGRRGDSITSNGRYQGYISRVIVEDKARTATEILNYYNLTKSNYGL